MEGERRGGWVYIMADRHRGTTYVGVTAYPAARTRQHRCGTGSDFCARHDLSRLVWAEHGGAIEGWIEHEKRPKRWRRAWKSALIERANADRSDLLA